jgi:hypothetical protein
MRSMLSWTPFTILRHGTHFGSALSRENVFGDERRHQENVAYEISYKSFQAD